MRRSRRSASGPRRSHREVIVPRPSIDRPTTKVRPKPGTIQGIAREARLRSSPCFPVRQATSSNKRKPRHHPEHREISTPPLHDRRSAAACSGSQPFILKQNRISPVGPDIADRSRDRHNTLGLFGWCCPPEVEPSPSLCRALEVSSAIGSPLFTVGLSCGALVIRVHGTS